MPLDRRLTFKTLLRKENRLRVPRVIRGQFKLEPTQMLKITLTLALGLGDKESFFGKMRKDGHTTGGCNVKRRHAEPGKPRSGSHA